MKALVTRSLDGTHTLATAIEDLKLDRLGLLVEVVGKVRPIGRVLGGESASGIAGSDAAAPDHGGNRFVEVRVLGHEFLRHLTNLVDAADP